jgi:hypothetical protein
MQVALSPAEAIEDAGSAGIGRTPAATARWHVPENEPPSAPRARHRHTPTPISARKLAPQLGRELMRRSLERARAAGCRPFHHDDEAAPLAVNFSDPLDAGNVCRHRSDRFSRHLSPFLRQLVDQ